jgi:glutathione-regulated potassium-efflux system ancillary protein KefC
MTTEQLLFAAAVLLAATALAVGLARRLNLGSIAALLAVGMLLGPHSPVSLFSHVSDLQAIGEIGVMLLLFLVGLETQPRNLWSMRRAVLGFGNVEFFSTSAAIAGFLLAVSHVNWQSALVIGLGLALSSSAIPLPILEARHETASAYGRITIGADIFQTLIVIPILAVIPLLGNMSHAGGTSLTAVSVLQVLAALAGVYVLGRVLLPRWLGLIPSEAGGATFTLVVLAGVFAAAWVMEKVGVSMALGAFMMGTLLSTSAFATQVKAAVNPAREVLLGVFFVAVGMAIDLKEAATFRAELLFYLPTILLLKVAVVYGAARAFSVEPRAAFLGALLLMPLDEIGYVIFASANAHGLLSARGHTLALLAISCSFLVSPIVINLGLRFAEPPQPSATRAGNPARAASRPSSLTRTSSGKRDART